MHLGSSTSRPTPAERLPGGNVAPTTAKQEGITDRLVDCGDGSPVTDIRPTDAGSSEMGGQRSQKARHSRRESGTCQMLEAERGPRCPSTDSTGETANASGRGTHRIEEVQVEDGGRQKPEQRGGSPDEKRPPTETKTGPSEGNAPSFRQVRTPGDRAEDRDGPAALGETMARRTLTQHHESLHREETSEAGNRTSTQSAPDSTDPGSQRETVLQCNDLEGEIAKHEKSTGVDRRRTVLSL